MPSSVSFQPWTVTAAPRTRAATPAGQEAHLVAPLSAMGIQPSLGLLPSGYVKIAIENGHL